MKKLKPSQTLILVALVITLLIGLVTVFTAHSKNLAPNNRRGFGYMPNTETNNL